jgi:hypothetical protein
VSASVRQMSAECPCETERTVRPELTPNQKPQGFKYLPALAGRGTIHACSLDMELLQHRPRLLAPSPPDGISHGRVSAPYEFTVHVSDPLGSPVSCRIDWGDGQRSDWTEPSPSGGLHTIAHAWERSGKYDVCAQARNARGIITSWGPAVRICVSGGVSERMGDDET